MSLLCEMRRCARHLRRYSALISRQCSTGSLETSTCSNSQYYMQVFRRKDGGFPGTEPSAPPLSLCGFLLLSTFVLPLREQAFSQEGQSSEVLSELHSESRDKDSSSRQTTASGAAGKEISNDGTAQWRLYTDLARDLFRRGKVSEAEVYLKRALEAARQGFGEEDPHVASACQNLAELYRLLHRYEEASPLYEDALRILGKVYGPKDIRLAFTLHNMAGFYMTQGKLEKAAELYEQSLRVKLASVGPGHGETANTQFHLAEVRWAQGRRKEAIQLSSSALDIMEQKGMSDAACKKHRTRLGDMLLQEGKPEDAENLLRAALNGISDTESQSYVTAAENLAVALKQQSSPSKRIESRNILREVSKVRRAAATSDGGRDRLALATTLRQLADVEHLLERTNFKKDRKEVESHCMDEDHVNEIVQRLKNLAVEMQTQSCEETSDPLQLISEAVQIAEEAYKRSVAEKANSPQSFDSRQSTQEEIEKAMRIPVASDAPSLSDKILGRMQGTRFWLKRKLSMIEKSNNDLKDLKSLQKRAARIESALLEIASCLHLQGSIVLESGKPEESIHILKQSLNYLEDVWTDNATNCDADSTKKLMHRQVSDFRKEQRMNKRFEPLRKKLLYKVYDSLQQAGKIAKDKGVVKEAKMGMKANKC